MDYRRFLARTEERVLPYTGGASVHASDRRLRLKGESTPGWWRFRVEGRFAAPLQAAEPEGLEDRPRVVGHWWEGWLFAPGGGVERVELVPEEQPPRFAPVSARRWHSGELLFTGLEFEGEAEEQVRRALEEGRTVADIAGVAATLRSAFAFAVLTVVSRRLQIPVHPAEVRRDLGIVADGGAPSAEAVLRRLEVERRLFQQRAEAQRRQLAEEAHRPALAIAGPSSPRALSEAAVRMRERRERLDPEERAIEALEAAGATVRHVRRIGGGNLEVVFVFRGERFVSVVEASTLQVVDAGICLSGEDSLVTLESLPSVIREAIAEDRLVITRHD